MPVRIVEPLEVIQIQHRDRKIVSIAPVPRQFTLQRLFQSAPIEHMGQRINNSLPHQVRFQP
jgi:hypothetical protein